MEESSVLKPTLICFSKLCKDKNEKAYFYGKEKSKLGNFFYREKKKYPPIFKDVKFSTGGDYYRSLEIEDELTTMIISRMIEYFAPDNHPFEVSGLYKFYEEVRDKKTFDKIALDFYNELGCLSNGTMRKDLEKVINNNS